MKSQTLPRSFTTLIKFKSLQAKAIGLLLGAVVVAAVLAYVVFSPVFSKTFEAELAKRGEAMAKILEQHQELRLALSLKDKEQATGVAKQILKGDTDARYAILLDSDNKPLGFDFANASESAQLDAIIQEHLKKTPSENGDIQRFTREVARASDSTADTGLDFAGGESAPTESKGLGQILLGLSAAAARQQLSNQTLATIVLTAVVLVVAFLIFFSSVSRRLNRIGHFASQVAAGNLTSTIDDNGQDEISKLAMSLAEMTEKTGNMVGRLQEAAQALAQTSSEILSSSTQQGESATRQAASVSETGATVAQLKETFKQAAERAQAVIDLAMKSEDSTSSGKTAVEQSVAAMEQIRDQVVTISKTMIGLVDRTNQIGTIIDAVNDLAEQSNVLALNAAIEAAKAGEQGRGFAVVAREVRSLAERSKDSTAQVRSILQDIEKASREALRVIEEGTQKTRAGMELAHRAGDSIANLDQAIGESSTAAKQIAASTRQQAVGVEQIWQAMRDIDRAVHESASGIRQLESASKNMKVLSDQMAQLVTRYQVRGRSSEMPSA
jgi:methyl-accepting chemotaxis protein